MHSAGFLTDGCGQQRPRYRGVDTPLRKHYNIWGQQQSYIIVTFWNVYRHYNRSSIETINIFYVENHVVVMTKMPHPDSWQGSSDKEKGLFCRCTIVEPVQLHLLGHRKRTQCPLALYKEVREDTWNTRAVLFYYNWLWNIDCILFYLHVPGCTRRLSRVTALGPTLGSTTPISNTNLSVPIGTLTVAVCQSVGSVMKLKVEEWLKSYLHRHILLGAGGGGQSVFCDSKFWKFSTKTTLR